MGWLDNPRSIQRILLANMRTPPDYDLLEYQQEPHLLQSAINVSAHGTRSDLLWQPYAMTLDSIQLRVLGALIEKEITTPENYPLSLNSLISACNQRSSRDPVLDLTEDEVRQALHSLEDIEMVSPVRDSRVPKYEHRIRTVLNLRRDETALLCLLMLRGPQTPGELRSRADRMHSFDDLAAVQATLERMANRDATASPNSPAEQATPLVVQLARQPGSRESRYAHLLAGPVSVGPLILRSADPPTIPDLEVDKRLSDDHLAARVEALEAALDLLKSQVDALGRASH